VIRVTDYVLASKLIAHFEGFAPKAYWDVNAFRVGYGSDTEGPEQIKVRRNTTTTRDRALQNLQARIPEYENTIIEQIGEAEWHNLPENAKAALLSFAYNYGSLTPTLETFLKTGKVGEVASAIQDRGVDNQGVNARRRYTEAAFVASVT
jgi:GH24 family phage-related lysozyme (muramidase)